MKDKEQLRTTTNPTGVKVTINVSEGTISRFIGTLLFLTLCLL